MANQPFFQSDLDPTRRVDIDCDAVTPDSPVLITVPNRSGTLFDAASTRLQPVDGVAADNVQAAVEVLAAAIELSETGSLHNFKAVGEHGWGDPYQAVLADSKYILTDAGNALLTVIYLPVATAAYNSGRMFRVQATRSASTPSDYPNMIAVYSPDNTSFLIGQQQHAGLCSSNAGDSMSMVLQLQPNNTYLWRVVDFSGWWENRA